MSTAKKPAPSLTPVAKAAGLSDWIEVFRAGTHTDSKGRSATYTTADLDQMVENHALGAAPAVIGHPKTDDPAYAWTSGMKRDGDSLFVKFGDINPAFEAGVASGAYRNRSVRIVKSKDSGWRVRHVGWLGAAPPAIDGLTPVNFSADEGEDFEFASGQWDALSSMAWALTSQAELLRGMREHLIEQSGIEAADKVLPSWQIDSLLRTATEAREALAREQQANSFTADPNPGDPMPISKEEHDAAVAQAKKEAEAAAEAKFAAQGAELAELRAARTTDLIANQINTWKAAGLVLPAEEPGLAQFMADIEGETELEFSAADGKAVKQTPAAWFASFIQGRKGLKLGATQQEPEDKSFNANSADDIGAKAVEYQAEQAKLGRTVSIELAVQHVSRTAASA